MLSREELYCALKKCRFLRHLSSPAFVAKAPLEQITAAFSEVAPLMADCGASEDKFLVRVVRTVSRRLFQFENRADISPEWYEWVDWVMSGDMVDESELLSPSSFRFDTPQKPYEDHGSESSSNVQIVPPPSLPGSQSHVKANGGARSIEPCRSFVSHVEVNLSEKDVDEDSVSRRKRSREGQKHWNSTKKQKTTTVLSISDDEVQQFEPRTRARTAQSKSGRNRKSKIKSAELNAVAKVFPDVFGFPCLNCAARPRARTTCSFVAPGSACGPCVAARKSGCSFKIGPHEEQVFRAAARCFTNVSLKAVTELLSEISHETDLVSHLDTARSAVLSSRNNKIAEFRRRMVGICYSQAGRDFSQNFSDAETFTRFKALFDDGTLEPLPDQFSNSPFGRRGRSILGTTPKDSS